jgi:phage FluMu protein Com
MPASAHSLPDSDADCRCHCGSLLARVSEDGVELKCRRCKRTHVIAWDDVEPKRPEAESPESHCRARARSRRTQWLEAFGEHS